MPSAKKASPVKTTAIIVRKRRSRSQSRRRCKGRTRSLKTGKQWSIVGKVVLITGPTRGIGKETALELARRGAKRIIMACITLEEGEPVARQIRETTKTQVVVRQVDLSSNDSVRQFASDILATERAIHVLINNAGILAPSRRTLSVDGNEMALATNYLGHFLLTNMLLGLLKQSAPSRIVNLGSLSSLIWLYSGRFHLVDDPNFDQQTSNYTWPGAYFQSKLAAILFTQSLHKRLQGSRVSTFTVDPGVVASDITKGYPYLLRFVYSYLAKTPAAGAKTSIYCATEPGIELLSSGYFSDCAPNDPGNYGEELADRLWRISEQLTGVNKNTI